MKLTFITLLFLLLISFTYSQTDQTYAPTAANLSSRKWFDSARFGMFIHWGASSVLGHGEWVMNQRNIQVKEYQRLIHFFNPVDFDAKKWVSTAKAAGMNYITLITRHHDGFSMWDTKQSDWKITNTVYGKDIVKQIADECQKQGLKLFFYYSLLDWFRSDYQYETGRTGKGTGRTQKSDWNSYIAFMKAQLTELLTNYGPVGGIWFDGHWDQLDNDHDKNGKSKVDWQYDEIYKLIHSLQPQCMIGNNHHLSPIAGEDFQMFEKDLPGSNTSGFGGASVSALPLETCETINDSWGFNITDRNHKSTKALVHYLVKASGFGANFLLNIGPMPNGQIQPEFVERLGDVGNWLKLNGETIYGTKPGFAKPATWGAITEKGNKVYLHVLNNPEDKLFIRFPYQIKSMKMFASKSAVKFQVLTDGYLVVNLKDVKRDELDTILEVDVTR
ncbi:MAG: alpha-L-fucosidase [Chitinophagaceae bacterium]|nr:alpha-L-fucosidase [Chitinophagaceae bacterium]